MPVHHVPVATSAGIFRKGTLAFLVTLVTLAPLAAQTTPDQAAEMLLGSARRAYNEKNYPFAVTRFREFLGRFGNHVGPGRQGSA